MKYFVQRSRGEPLEVEVAACDDGRSRVRLGEAEFRADFEPVDRLGQYVMLLDHHAFAVSIEEEEGQCLAVTIAGSTYHFQVLDERERAARAVGGGSEARAETVVALMPGVVVDVRVRPGDVLEPGTPVVVLEAMKMQNEVPTEHGGVVQEVLVEPGTTVAANAPLVRLAPPEEG